MASKKMFCFILIPLILGLVELNCLDGQPCAWPGLVSRCNTPPTPKKIWPDSNRSVGLLSWMNPAKFFMNDSFLMFYSGLAM